MSKIKNSYNIELLIGKNDDEILSDFESAGFEPENHKYDFLSTVVGASNESAEAAFKEAFTDSSLSIKRQDHGGIITSSTLLEARLLDASEHLPVVQDGIDALNAEGYDAQVAVNHMTMHFGKYLDEVIDDIESTGCTIHLQVAGADTSYGPVDLEMVYNPQAKSFIPYSKPIELSEASLSLIPKTNEYRDKEFEAFDNLSQTFGNFGVELEGFLEEYLE